MRRFSLSVITTAAVALAGVFSVANVDAKTTVSHTHRLSGLVRSGTGWSSSNWSGYAVTGSGFTAITGSWVVPSVSATKKSTYSSSWIGIDGFNNSNLIQTGTEQDWYNGSAHYYAWWEILPAAETQITGFTVNPGDVVTADVHQVSGTSWSITINDVTRSETFNTSQTYTGPGTSGEWVEEAPTVGGHIATLAHYSSPTLFDPGTLNGFNPSLTAAESGVMIQGRSQVSTPSAPDSETDGFNVSYGATAPAPPSS